MARNVQIDGRKETQAGRTAVRKAPAREVAQGKAAVRKTAFGRAGTGRSNKRRRRPTPQELGYTQREWNRINELDARERRRQRRLVLALFALAAVAVVLGYLVYVAIFRSHDYTLSMPYQADAPVYGLDRASNEPATAPAFAADLCVTDSDVHSDLLSIGALEAGLFDLTQNDVIYAKDIFTRRSPASLTKIMTVLVALKNANVDDMVTITDTALQIEYGSSVCDVKPGDVLSLKQLLYGLIVASGNDAAMMIAEHVGGSVDHFVEMMNEEALRLGATRTHFMNPHGLTASDHYTCVYDLYLIFKEAMKYDLFMDMISRTNYYAEYRREDSSPVSVTWESTNHYFTGEAAKPENVMIYGGKTGTTQDAGACLIVLAKDPYGNPYLAAIMHAADKEVLYAEMNGVLSLTDLL